MNNIINLTTIRRARLQARAKGVTLCRAGFHKWKTVTDKCFDVRQGKLITVQRCIRCEQERTRLT
jgi:predicted metal-binding membrane protein